MSDETKNANTMELSRRNLLKATVAGLLAGVAAPVLSYLSPSLCLPQQVPAGKKC